MDAYFTNTSDNDILEISYDYELESLKDEMRIAKYHNENSIYLYCTVETNVAERIIRGVIDKLPLVLYETESISRAMAKNIQNPSTLRIAINVCAKDNSFYYDELTMNDNIIKNKIKVKSIQEFKTMCKYTRTLVSIPNCKQKVIEYTVNNKELICSSQLM